MEHSRKRMRLLVVVAIIVLLLNLLVGGMIAVHNNPKVQLKREMEAFNQALAQEDLDGM